MGEANEKGVSTAPRPIALQSALTCQARGRDVLCMEQMPFAGPRVLKATFSASCNARLADSLPFGDP